MKWARLILLSVFTLCSLCGKSWSKDRPIVAVFNIEAKRIKLPKSLVDLLSDHLATRLAETGEYQVVPRDQLKQRLLQQKKKSHRQCYDQSCQIEIGKEIAAEKTLATQIGKIGSICTVNSTLYDLRKAAAEQAASSRGKCTEEALLDSLEKIVTKLGAGKVKKEVVATAQPKPNAKPGETKTVAKPTRQPTSETRTGIVESRGGNLGVSGGLEALPGKGFGSVIVGRSTVKDVLDAFGRDCIVYTYDDRYKNNQSACDKPLPPRIWEVSYAHDRSGKYNPSRPANAKRPSSIRIDGGIVTRMSFGVYQKDVHTSGGINNNSSRADVLRVFGKDYTFEKGSSLDKLIYTRKGIEFWIDREKEEVNSFRIYPAK